MQLSQKMPTYDESYFRRMFWDYQSYFQGFSATVKR